MFHAPALDAAATTLCMSLTLQEIQLLKGISHDCNIVQFYGACLETQPPMLIMEYMGVRMHRLLCLVSTVKALLSQCHNRRILSERGKTAQSAQRVLLFKAAPPSPAEATTA